MNEGEARPSPRYGLEACIDYARINKEQIGAQTQKKRSFLPLIQKNFLASLDDRYENTEQW